MDMQQSLFELFISCQLLSIYSIFCYVGVQIIRVGNA